MPLWARSLFQQRCREGAWQGWQHRPVVSVSGIQQIRRSAHPRYMISAGGRVRRAGYPCRCNSSGDREVPPGNGSSSAAHSAQNGSADRRWLWMLKNSSSSEAAGVVVDVHQNWRTCQSAWYRPALMRLSGRAPLPPGLHFGRAPAAADQPVFWSCLVTPMRQGHGQLCHHQRVDMVGLCPWGYPASGGSPFSSELMAIFSTPKRQDLPPRGGYWLVNSVPDADTQNGVPAPRCDTCAPASSDVL